MWIATMQPPNETALGERSAVAWVYDDGSGGDEDATWGSEVPSDLVQPFHDRIARKLGLMIANQTANPVSGRPVVGGRIETVHDHLGCAIAEFLEETATDTCAPFRYVVSFAPDDSFRIHQIA
jgi:hypothetical protein